MRASGQTLLLAGNTGERKAESHEPTATARQDLTTRAGAASDLQSRLEGCARRAAPAWSVGSPFAGSSAQTPAAEAAAVPCSSAPDMVTSNAAPRGVRVPLLSNR